MAKGFTIKDREALLTLKFVGEKVISRLEEIGFYNLDSLKTLDTMQICEMVSAHVGTTCWKNSPQAKSAIDNIIEFANKSGD